MHRTRFLVAGLVAAAVAVPAGATAKPGNGHGQGHGGGHGQARHGVQYVFKGTYAGGSAVSVDHGNKAVRRANLVGTTVQFDLSNAKLTVGDSNGDGTVDLTDVLNGDAVVVKARLPKADPGSQPFAATHLVDQTNSGEEY